MSIWLLIVLVVVGWTLVSVAFGLFLGRIVRAHQRGGTMDFSGFAAGDATTPPGGSELVTIVKRIGADEGQSAA